MRFDAHFGDNERFDPYLSLGLGYRTTSTSYISDRPGFVETPRETLIPVALDLLLVPMYGLLMSWVLCLKLD